LVSNFIMNGGDGVLRLWFFINNHPIKFILYCIISIAITLTVVDLAFTIGEMQQRIEFLEYLNNVETFRVE
jgi:hypothetical protein